MTPRFLAWGAEDQVDMLMSVEESRSLILDTIHLKLPITHSVLYSDVE